MDSDFKRLFVMIRISSEVAFRSQDMQFQKDYTVFGLIRFTVYHNR